MEVDYIISVTGRSTVWQYSCYLSVCKHDLEVNYIGCITQTELPPLSN